MLFFVIILALVLVAGVALKFKNLLAKQMQVVELQQIEEAADSAKRHLAYEAQRAEEAMRRAAVRGWPR